MRRSELHWMPEASWRRTAFVYSAAGVGVVGIAFLARFLLNAGLTWRCPSIVMLGMPCPSCGITRSLSALVELRWTDAFFFNPLFVMALAGVLFLPRIRPRWGELERRGAWLYVVGAVCLNWVYLLLFLPP